MISNIPNRMLENLTVRELEDLLALKRNNTKLSDLLKERDRLRLETRRIEDSIDAMERHQAEEARRQSDTAGMPPAGFLVGRRKKGLKDFIAQVLLDAGEPLAPAEIQRRLPQVGYSSSAANPRSFYNTVFQALQRYEAFRKEGRKYTLAAETVVPESGPAPEILPKQKTRLKDFIVDVLRQAAAPLKVSEIASRVVIAGYETDLGMDDLTQRVSATMKKYLNSDFEWDSQRYRLSGRN
jgi:uncharacterized protein YdcH (DUF465 family)